MIFLMYCVFCVLYKFWLCVVDCCVSVLFLFICCHCVCDCMCVCLLFVYNIFEKQAMNVIFDDVSCSDIRTFIDVIK